MDYQRTTEVIDLLDERTKHFLASGAVEGQRNEELYHASQQLCWNGIDSDQAEGLLLPPAEGSGLKADEVRRTIRSAYRTKGDMLPRVEKFYEQKGGRYSFRQWAEASFRDGENIFIASADTPYEHIIIPRNKLIELHESNNLPISSLAGIYVTCNPIAGDRRRDSEVTRFQHAIVEFDHLPIEKQWETIIESNLPITSAIYSGKKSIHFWVNVGAENIEEYRARCKVLAEMFPACDKKLLHPGCWTRLPEVQRDKSIQRLEKMNFGAKSWEDWIKDDEDPRDKELEVADWIDHVDEKIPDELVKGIIHKGCRMILGGQSKSRKSWSLLDMALSIASGTPWIGHETTKARIVLVNMEIHPSFLQQRIKSIMSAKGLKTSDIRGNLYLLNRRGNPCAADEVAKLIHKKVHKLGNVSAVIIDPIYKTLNGLDENKAGDIALLMNVFDRMSASDDISVIFAAHFAKGAEEREAIDRVSGSGVFARDPDSFVTFSRKILRKKLGKRGRTIVEVVKNRFMVECYLRNHPETEDLEVEWNFPLFSRVIAPPVVEEPPIEVKEILAPKKKVKKELAEMPSIPSKVVNGVMLSGLDQMVMSYIPVDGIKREDLADKCMETLKMSSDSLGKRLQKIASTSLLVKKFEKGIEVLFLNEKRTGISDYKVLQYND